MTDHTRLAEIPLSSATAAWLREGHRRIGLGHQFRMRWQSAWNDINWSLSRRIQSLRPAADIQDPVFVIGPWRSGTTVMHELLHAATGLPTTETWQCMNACSFSLTAPPTNSRATRSRPMDSIAVRSDSPQEDEFALLTLGTPSAYRAFLSPRRLGELEFTLCPDYWLDHPEWHHTWIEFLGAALATKPGSPRRLLLKSPNHTYRLTSILQRFPSAQMLWMARDPLEVLHSNRKMWVAMCRLYSQEEPDPMVLDQFLCNALLKAAVMVEWCAQNLPRDQFVVVSMDELRKAGPQVVKMSVERFGLMNGFDETRLERMAASTYKDAGERYGGTLSVAGVNAAHCLAKAYERALASHGV